MTSQIAERIREQNIAPWVLVKSERILSKAREKNRETEKESLERLREVEGDGEARGRTTTRETEGDRRREAY